jgi:hypothetical protein
MNRASLWLSVLCVLACCLQFAACGGSSSSGGSDTVGGVTTTSLPDGKVGSAYSATLTATGGTPPYTWTLESGIEGSLPTGLTLSTAGVISGTPTEPGLFGSLAFTATDAKGNSANSTALSIDIKALPLIITTTSLPNAVVGQPYASAVTRTGGDPPFTWAIKSGSLPPGLTLQPGGGITGTPTGPGVNPLVFQVTDSDKTVATSSNLAINLTLTVATTSLPGANQNKAYSTMLQATGGVPPYTWSGPDGGWPPLLPLTLDPSTGVISGTPNIPGPFGALQFSVKDSTGATATSQNLLIFVQALPLVITTTSLPEAFIANPYGGFGSSVPLTYTGGDPPIIFSIKSEALPPGLTIPGQCYCFISGTPTVQQNVTYPVTYPFVLQATDSDGTVATAPLSIQVGERVTITTTSLPNGTIGSSYSTALAANYGTPPYTFSFQLPPPQINTLPPNVYLMPDGTISGTPLADGQGPVLFFQVTDNLGNVGYGAMNQIFLYPQLLITTTSLPGSAPGDAYSATLAGKGGLPPYTWSIASGSLPANLALNSSTGVISGTVTAPDNTYPVTFTLKDSNNITTNSVPLSITIATPPPLSVLTTTLPGTNDNTPYSATLQAFSGVPPYTWSVNSGTLPTGLTLNGSTGVISGTATASGTAVVFKVEDSTHTTALSNSMTIQVASPACPTGAESKMSSQQPYAFMLRGFDPSGPVAVAGSFTTDGAGGIAGGQLDVNSAGGYFHASSLNLGLSSYTLGQDIPGADPRGCLTLTTSSGTTVTFRFMISGNDGNGHYMTGHILEFDDADGTGTNAAGIIRRQDTSTFTQGPNGTYAFQFIGTDKHSGRFGLAGSMNMAAQGITDVVADADAAGVLTTDSTGGSGTYLNPDPVSGHGTGSLIVGSNSAYDLQFSYYQVNANEIIFVSSGSLNVAPIFGGEALLSAGPFTASQLTHYFLYHTTGTSASGAGATLGVINFDGTSLLNGTYSQDVAGVSTSNNPVSGSYTVDATSGRVLFSGNFGSGSAPVGYLIAPTLGDTTPMVYLVGTDAAATSGLMEFQSTSSTVNLASLTGVFALGTDDTPDASSNEQTGSLTIFPTSPPMFTFGGTADQVFAGPGGLAADQTFAGIAHLNTAGGVGDFGANTTAVTNGTVVYYINEDPTITHPVVVRIEP